MSADAPGVPATRGLLADPRDRRVVRYAFGATLAMAVAMGLAWDLSFVVPLLSLMLLASPAPRPSLAKGFAFVATIAVACLAGLWVIKYLLSYTWVFFPVLGLLMLGVFLAKARGVSPFLVMWLLIALLLLPMIAVQSPDLALILVRGLVLGATATLLVVWTAHVLVPDPPLRGPVVGAKPPVPAVPTGESARQALIQTLVVLPILVVFHLFEWTGAILVLIFVALLSMQPGFASGFKAGRALLAGNAMGGVAAIVMFGLLTVVPEFAFLVLLTLLAGLFFGSRLMSDRPTAPLYGMAYSTLLLVIGMTTSTTGDAKAKVYQRLFQIGLAVVYVVVAFGLIERWRSRRRG
jgi:hypothetical protein